MDPFLSNNGDNNREQNLGAQALESMPSYAEHMRAREEATREKSFSELSADERPEGVRDEQDYREMLDEQDRKLGEQQSFIEKHYFDHGPEANNEEMLEFIYSEDLKIITKYNFNLADLAKKGIISETDRWTNDNKYPYYWKRGNIKAIGGDARIMVQDLAGMLEWREDEECPADDAPFFAKRLHQIFDKWDEPEKLGADDYEYIIGEIGASSPIGYRLLFGNPEVNYPNEDESDLSVMSHTMRLLDFINQLTDEDYLYSFYSDVLIAAEDVINSDAISDSHRDMARRALGEVGHAHLSDLLEHPTRRTAKLALKCMSRQDVSRVKKWQDSFSDENLPIFTDEELLGSIYSLRETKNETKYYGRRDPDYYLARHINVLEKEGFSRESLVNIIHDNNIHLTAEEVRDMERDGVDDTDIAYAGRAYEHFSFNKDDVLELRDEAFSKLDEGDILRAIFKARKRGEKI